jgi:hypothetical protein
VASHLLKSFYRNAAMAASRPDCAGESALVYPSLDSAALNAKCLGYLCRSKEFSQWIYSPFQTSATLATFLQRTPTQLVLFYLKTPTTGDETMYRNYNAQTLSPEILIVCLGLFFAIAVAGTPVIALFGVIGNALRPLLAF